MANKTLKSLERRLKRLLERALLIALPSGKKSAPEPIGIRKILVFRLDQRLGNGIMLLPLLQAVRKSHPDAALHFFIHYPVANLFEKTTGDLLQKIWFYNQPALMKKPWRYLSLIRQLRHEKFDIAITSHNPDNFSLSQAIFGRLLKSQCLIGFDAKNNAHFYDLAVKSSIEKHYTDAMLDLWRVITPGARCKFGGFKISKQLLNDVQKDYPQYKNSGILIWLGATGNKTLPPTIFSSFEKALNEYPNIPIYFAAGPADRKHIMHYPGWVREQVCFWEETLLKTAAFFTQFSLFISGDTGPMHLAVALGVPTLTIFVDSNMKQYGYKDGKKHFSMQWKNSPEDVVRISEVFALAIKAQDI